MGTSGRSALQENPYIPVPFFNKRDAPNQNLWAQQRLTRPHSEQIWAPTYRVRAGEQPGHLLEPLGVRRAESDQLAPAYPLSLAASSAGTSTPSRIAVCRLVWRLSPGNRAPGCAAIARASPVSRSANFSPPVSRGSSAMKS